jgi:uncharacterized membrane protein YeaQ/YmgE (transglycosylase-associated protein family)
MMEPVRQISYIRVSRAAFWGGLFAAKNLAFALTTELPSAAMLSTVKEERSSKVVGGNSRLSEKGKGRKMTILAWLVVGLIAGWLASQVMRGGGYGLIGDIIVGVVGALLGGFLATTLLKMPNPVNGINVTSILVAFIGAVILIAILRMVSGRRRLA